MHEVHGGPVQEAAIGPVKDASINPQSSDLYDNREEVAAKECFHRCVAGVKRGEGSEY